MTTITYTSIEDVLKNAFKPTNHFLNKHIEDAQVIDPEDEDEDEEMDEEILDSEMSDPFNGKEEYL